MSEHYKKYRRAQTAELADWHPNFDMTNVSISDEDLRNGSPLPGDKIARNPKNHKDRWLVSAEYFKENFAPVENDLEKENIIRKHDARKQDLHKAYVSVNWSFCPWCGEELHD